MSYTISLSRTAEKGLGSLHSTAIEDVLARVEGLASVPRPTGTRKLNGFPNYWRIRVGDVRVIYSIDDKHRMIEIKTIAHRKDVYR